MIATTISARGDGIVEGRTVWVPTVGRGTVIDLTPWLATIDCPHRTSIVTALRHVLIPGDLADRIPAACLANDWGNA